MEEEIWKDVVGFEGKYQVSNLGNVRSLQNKRGSLYILKKGKTPNGYLTVSLSKNNKIHHRIINKLVAEAFIPNPNNFSQTNHKNEIKEDNRAENLEWCTAKYNTNYGNRNSKISKKVRKTLTTMRSRPVKCVETGQVFIFMRCAARYINDHEGTISNICNHKPGFHTAGGYHWEYVNGDVKNVIKDY